MHRMRRPLVLALAALCTATLLGSCDRPRRAHLPVELWFYDEVNLKERDAIDKIRPVWTRAAAAGYTTVVIDDPKFARPDEMTERYRTNARLLVLLAETLKLEIVPTCFGIGRGNGGLLAIDPNLAEAVPVRDARFVVKGGVAELTPDPPVALAARPDKVEWGITVRGGLAVAENPIWRARMRWTVPVSPWRCYHLSVRVKTDGFKVAPVLRVTDGKRRLDFISLKHQPTRDWTTQDVVFDSFGSSQVVVTIGVLRRSRGLIEWRDWKLEEVGPVNLVRRPTAPLVIREERTGRVLTEGRDFEPLADTLMGNSPWRGQFDHWHAVPVIRTRGIADGTYLRASWYKAGVVSHGQVAACASDTAVTRLLAAEAASTDSLFHPRRVLLGIDEIRVLGWDPSCTATPRSAARILGDQLRTERALLPGHDVIVWNDMFDPLHNAVKDYYLVNGDLTGSWDALDPSITVMNWNGEHRHQSLAFFGARGNPQVIAGYYDGKPEGVAEELRAAEGVPGVKAVMYTTWKNRYDDLEAYARAVMKAGWR